MWQTLVLDPTRLIANVCFQEKNANRAIELTATRTVLLDRQQKSLTLLDMPSAGLMAISCDGTRMIRLDGNRKRQPVIKEFHLK